MAFGTIDKRFVEDFQNVAFDLCRVESGEHDYDPADERFALGIGDDPIEKIAFDRAVDPCRCKRFAGEKTLRIVFTQMKNRERDTFGDDDEKRMLDPKRVALDLTAINQFQQSAQS